MDSLFKRRTADGQRALVAGHRGMMALYPENTLLGFREAINSGVDMIEFDLNMTSDKHIVIIHDNTVDRTTDGSGAVRDMTLEHVKSLDAGGRFGKAFEGLKIPTLSELCDLVRPHSQLLFNVEIKEYTKEIADTAVGMLADFGLIERCVFTCFDAAILEYMHDAHGVLTQGFPSEYMTNFGSDTYKKMYAAGIALKPFKSKPDMRLLTQDLVAEFNSMGIKPWCFCPDDEAAVAYSLGCGARLLTCNDPVPALRAVRNE